MYVLFTCILKKFTFAKSYIFIGIDGENGFSNQIFQVSIKNFLKSYNSLF